jgi:hypothetical protein
MKREGRGVSVKPEWDMRVHVRSGRVRVVVSFLTERRHMLVTRVGRKSILQSARVVMSSRRVMDTSRQENRGTLSSTELGLCATEWVGLACVAATSTHVPLCAQSRP